MAVARKSAGGAPAPSMARGRISRAVIAAAALVAVAATACSLPEREHVDPVAIKTNVLGCDDHTARGTLINDFLVDATGKLTVQWVDFFGDVYYEQTAGPFDVAAGGRTDWTVTVEEDIKVPGHCTVQLDFRG